MGFVDDQARIWTMALTGTVFMAGALLFNNVRDGACARYYTYITRFDHIWGRLLFRSPSRFVDALKHFCLYYFSCRMGTDPVKVALTYPPCGKADLEKTAVRDRFMCYEFLTGVVHGISEEAVQSMKRVKFFDSFQTTVTFTVFPATVHISI